MMNSAIYALQMLQYSMQGEAAKAGLQSVEDVDNLIMEKRSADKS